MRNWLRTSSTTTMLMFLVLSIPGLSGPVRAEVWSPLGSGVGYGDVRVLTLDKADNLYAGGYFVTAGGMDSNCIARWNGSSWSPLGSAMNDWVHALIHGKSGNLYAGGNFTLAGGSGAKYVAKWNGSFWSPLGSGTDGTVRALALDNLGNLYAGGYFTTAGGVTANYIAKWNGGQLARYGHGNDNDPQYDHSPHKEEQREIWQTPQSLKIRSLDPWHVES